MAVKKPKKPTQKKPTPQFPKIPKDGSVKVIELNPIRILGYIFFTVLIGYSLLTAWMNYLSPEKITYHDDKGINQIMSLYQSGSYEEIVISGHRIEAKKPTTKNMVNGKEIVMRDIDRTNIPENLEITDVGLPDPKNPTKVTIENNDVSNTFWDIVPSLLGTILFVGLLLFLMNRMSGGGMGGPMAFIKSRAKVYDPEIDEQVTFADVAGSDEEKSDLEEVVDFLKNPGKYKDLGAKIPRGILLQ